jgi:hypothetical protein
MWAPCRRAFFDARPVGLEPRGDRLRVALAGHSFGLLRGEPSLPQPGAEISRVEPDVELLADQLPQPHRRPEFGLETMVRRAVVQPAEGDLLLGRGELAGPPRDRPEDEAVVPPVAERGQPTPHSGRIDPEEVGDLLGRVSVGNALDGEPPSVFQLVRRTGSPHAEQSTRSEAERALLS